MEEVQQMSEKTLSGVQILMRNDTATNWTTNNPVLGKGEMGVEINTGKFKFGDGTKAWTALGYSGVLVTASNTNGNIKIDGVETTVYVLPISASDVLGGIKSTTGKGAVTVNGTTGAATVSSVETADKLATAREIAVAGDVTGQANFDGSANISISATLAASGVTAGTYTKITVDAKGRVTVGATLAATDIPSLTLAKISDAGTAASKDTGTSAGNVPVLDANGKLASSVIPEIALGKTKVVANDTARYALTTSDVQEGDVVIVTGTDSTYYVIDDTKLDSADGYTRVLVPGSGVSSVNGQSGTVSLTTDNVSEGSTNLYYTASRFDTAFAGKASSGLTDGSTILHSSDTLIIDCGSSSNGSGS